MFTGSSREWHAQWGGLALLQGDGNGMPSRAGVQYLSAYQALQDPPKSATDGCL